MSITIKNDHLAEISKSRHRNEKCWCESGKKIKNCDCLDKLHENRNRMISQKMQEMEDYDEVKEK
jgi:hypothetical protein